MPTPFLHTLVIQLQHTDTYGRLFYPQQTTFCHGVLQAWLESVGLPLPAFPHQTDHIVVVVHLESDYNAPLALGDRLTAELCITAVGTTSFTYSVRFVRQDQIQAGICTIVMVTVEPRSGNKVPLPAPLRAALTTAMTA